MCLKSIEHRNYIYQYKLVMNKLNSFRIVNLAFKMIIPVNFLLIEAPLKRLF